MLKKQIALLSFLCFTSYSLADLLPIDVTGWEEDIVLGVGESYSAGSTAQLDDVAGGGGGATVWYEIGYNESALSTGLPSVLTESETTSGLYFQLQDFGSGSGTNNNAVYEGGTLTLTTPASYDRIALFGATGSGTADLIITLNYTTGSPDVFSSGNDAINQDWFNGSSIAYTANGRISTNNGIVEHVDSDNPRLYERIFDADETRLLESVGIVDIAEGTQRNVIMAISGEAIVPIPEPATVVLMLLAGATILGRRRLQS
jgi:hypothetical protein